MTIATEANPAAAPAADPSWEFLPSRVDHEATEFTPLFFYHIPRTGGLSLYSRLRASLHFTYLATTRAVGSPESPGAAEPLSARFDYAIDNPQVFSAFYAVIATHLGFGLHHQFRQRPFLLATVVRRPAERVLSEFTYTCMRRGQPPERGAFAAFIRDQANINRAVKQLAGEQDFDQPAEAGALRRSQAHLTRHFHAYVTDRQVSALTSHYLSRFRLANVASNPINITVPAYRFDASDWQDELTERNALDQALYAFVERAGRLPVLPGMGERLHPLTLLMRQTDGLAKAEADYTLRPTAEVLARLGPTGG